QFAPVVINHPCGIDLLSVAVIHQKDIAAWALGMHVFLYQLPFGRPSAYEVTALHILPVRPLVTGNTLNQPVIVSGNEPHQLL
ncbi:MAG TPA: hypothetical protein V6D20_12830, partial [Candidatus Obscuribacterales bacterium]